MLAVVKISVVLATAATLVLGLVLAERGLEQVRNPRQTLLWRSMLYAFLLTPTAYHHPPNTIVAPLHLSTIGGHLFYGYEYTLEMFLFGVALPLMVGWAAIVLFLVFAMKLPQTTPSRRSR